MDTTDTYVKHSHLTLAIGWVHFAQTILRFWYFTHRLTETIRMLLSLCHIMRGQSRMLRAKVFHFGDFNYQLKPQWEVIPSCDRLWAITTSRTTLWTPVTSEQTKYKFLFRTYTPDFDYMLFEYMIFLALFWLYGQSDFSTKVFGYMVISTILSTLPGQNRWPYIRNPVYEYTGLMGANSSVF